MTKKFLSAMPLQPSLISDIQHCSAIRLTRLPGEVTIAGHPKTKVLCIVRKVAIIMFGSTDRNSLLKVNGLYFDGMQLFDAILDDTGQLKYNLTYLILVVLK